MYCNYCSNLGSQAGQLAGRGTLILQLYRAWIFDCMQTFAGDINRTGGTDVVVFAFGLVSSTTSCNSTPTATHPAGHIYSYILLRVSTSCILGRDHHKTLSSQKGQRPVDTAILGHT